MAHITLRDQQTLSVRVIGRGQPVLMLSGLGMASSHWLPFIAPFLHRFKFYIPDYRGFGGSANTPFVGTHNDVYQSHMQDIEDVVAHFQLKDFLLVGYSLGASTAMHWMQYGNFAEQSILRYLHIDQTPCLHNKDDWSYGLMGEQQGLFFDNLHHILEILVRNPQVTVLSELPLRDKQQLLAIWANTLKSMLGKAVPQLLLKLAPHHTAVLKQLVPFHDIAQMQVYIRSYLQQKYDYRTALAQSQLPITFFIGQQSALYPAAGQHLIAESVPHSQQVIFKKSGHTPLFNEPVKFVRELGRFLQQHSSPMPI